MRWLAAAYAVIRATAERAAWLGRTPSPFRRGRIQFSEEDQQVPNRFTRVPERPVPPLPWLGRMVLPLADLFMILMASRPRSGSLRTTWVAPATIVLCLVAVVGGILLEVVVLRVGVGDRSVPALIGAAVLAVLVVGSACVAVIGIVQRR
jgi:hypothetical protein